MVLAMPVRICVIALKMERVCGIRTSGDDASLITELAAPSDARRELEALVIALKVGQAPVCLPWVTRGSIAEGARATSLWGTHLVPSAPCKKGVWNTCRGPASVLQTQLALALWTPGATCGSRSPRGSSLRILGRQKEEVVWHAGK